MTIGIGAFGRRAGAAVLAAWAEAERRAAGDLHGFAVFTVLGADGEPESLECQRGGLATLRAQYGRAQAGRGRADALARMAEAEVAGVITSGPDRPEPLSQFLAAGPAGLVTGHRLPNLATAEGVAANRAALALIGKGLPPRHAVEAVLEGDPDIDAGLIAVTRTGLGVANSARVQGRDDLGQALILAADRRYGFGLLHNSIAPIEGLAAAVAAAGEAVLRQAWAACSGRGTWQRITDASPFHQAAGHHGRLKTAAKGAKMTDGVGFSTTMLNERTIEMIVTGYPAADDLLAFIHATFPDATFSHVLWNFSRASLAMLEIGDFKDLAAAGRQFAAARGADARTAVLVQSTADVLLVRAYSAMTLDLRPMAVRAATDRQELLDWLGA